MSQLKLTKNELKFQQQRLVQLERYLPTLQLKKSMLQVEVLQAQAQIDTLLDQQAREKEGAESFVRLLGGRVEDLLATLLVDEVRTTAENIAGVDIPSFHSVRFREQPYSFFSTPFWYDEAQKRLESVIEVREKLVIANTKKRLLQKELREVSIRVNLFDRVLIPRANANIKKIKIFLSDQQLASVAQAKVAKRKIALRRRGQHAV